MKELTFKHNDLWVSPEGKCYDGKAHALQATKIFKDIVGLDLDEDDIFGLRSAEDALIRTGWIKLTTSLMFPYYKEDGMYDHLTNEQAEVYMNFCNYHNMK